ncbi:MAG: beta family protein [Acidobacteria bacterium]|nr:beta family protein [Acidobacteriota bacterium]
MLAKSDYVPILRVKRAEIAAVTNLVNEDFARITPFFEMCEHTLDDRKLKSFRDLDPVEYLWGVHQDLAGACGNRSYFIDFGNVEAAFSHCSRHPLEIFFELADWHAIQDIKPVPVTGLRRSNSHQQSIRSVLNSRTKELCLRISQKEIREPTMDIELLLLLRNLSVAPEQVHLLIDLEEVNADSSSIEEICERMPMLNRWLSFVVAGGSFPRFLSDLTKNEEHVLPRQHWQRWRTAFEEQSRIERLPTYSDYSIQYPKRPAPLPFVPKVSASIRYADLNHWIIMRGEWLGRGAKFDQYWGLANALMHREEFSGADFSFADEYIARIGGQTKETGNVSTWLTAGINRHLTLVARQLAQLFADPVYSAKGRFGRLSRPALPTAWNNKRITLPDSFAQAYLFPAE